MPCKIPNSPVCHQSQHKQLPIPSSPHKGVGKRKHLSGSPMVLGSACSCLGAHIPLVHLRAALCPIPLTLTNKTGCQPAPAGLGGRNEQEQGRQTHQDSLFSSRIPREAGRGASAAALLCHERSDLYNRRKV